MIFSDFLGLSFETVIHDKDLIFIEYQGRCLSLPNTFLSKSKMKWLNPVTLPKQPLTLWDTSDCILESNLIPRKIPIIYGTPGMKISKKTVEFNVDIIGSIFFMLSRYEEVISKKKDQFGRYEAKSSLAFQESFLHRAIVNEYLDILWFAMQHLWPDLDRKMHTFQILVSADVDEPYSFSTKSFYRLFKRIGGDLLKRGSMNLTKKTIINYHKAKRGNYNFDPYFPIFNWMMDVNEEVGNTISFYFLVNKNKSKMDGYYDVEEPIISNLIDQILHRGHEIGLHASYDSYLDPQKIVNEANMLRSILDKHGIEQYSLGSRQHYLRWQTPDTPRYLNQAKIAYDASLGFADHIGFRSGTCYEYRFFDLEKLSEMDLIIRPLVIMDVSVFNYMGFAYNQGAEDLINELKATCRRHNGCFTILWHNSQLFDNQAKRIYKKIIV